MRYRMEMIDDKFVIRNVETDLGMGSAQPSYMRDPRRPEQDTFVGCDVKNNVGEVISSIRTSTVPNPLEQASVAVANYEAMAGYPDLKPLAKAPDPCRVEWRLGALIADAVVVIAQAVIEHQAGDLTEETKSKYVDVVAQLDPILYASSFGSFDGERGVFEPYFANGSGARLVFSEAVQKYGLIELRLRFPDISEPKLRALLSLPLNLLEDLVNRLLPAHELAAAAMRDLAA